MKKNSIFAFIFLLHVVFLVILNAFCTNANIPDYEYYIMHTYSFQWNPYTNPEIAFYWKYPGLYFLYMGTLGAFGLHSDFGIRLFIGIFDIINCIIIAQIAKQIQAQYQPKKDAQFNPWIFSLLYFYFPQHITALISGENDIIALTFLLYAVNRFLERKAMISAISLGLGIMFKVFPIFLLIPVGIYYIKAQKWKELIKYLIWVGIIFFLTSLPFLIQNPSAYIRGIFLHASRLPTGFTYSEFLDIPYQVAFILLGIKISYMFLGQIICLGILLIVLYRRKTPSNPIDIIQDLVYSLLIISIAMFSDNLTSFVRYLPFLILSEYFVESFQWKRIEWMTWIFFGTTVIVIWNNFTIVMAIVSKIIIFMSVFLIFSFGCISKKFNTEKLILLLSCALVMIVKTITSTETLKTEPYITLIILLRVYLYGIMLYLLIKHPKLRLKESNNSNLNFSFESIIKNWNDAMDEGVKYALIDRIKSHPNSTLKEQIFTEILKIEKNKDLQEFIQQQLLKNS